MKTIIQYLILVIVFSLAISKIAFAEWDEWLVDSEIAFSAVDNVNQAINDDFAESEQIWNIFSSIGRNYHFSGYTRLNLSAQVHGDVHQQFSGLNQLNSGIKLSIQHKFGLGPLQPWIKGYVSSGYNVSESKIRQGVMTKTGFQIGKPLHERIDMVIGYQFDHRDSRNGDPVNSQKLIQAGFNSEQVRPSSVYDIEGHSLELQLNGLLTQQLLISLGYSYRKGDIVSTSDAANASVYESVIDAIVNDDALPGWAYRSDGFSHTYSLDANYDFLQADASINLGYQHTEGHAESFTYRTNLFRILFSYYF